MKASAPLWLARIGLPLVIIPALVFAGKTILQGHVAQGLGIGAMQALLIVWAVKAWAK